MFINKLFKIQKYMCAYLEYYFMEINGIKHR